MSVPDRQTLLRTYWPRCVAGRPANEMGFYSAEEQLAYRGCNYASVLSEEEANAIISRHLCTIQEAAAVLVQRMNAHPDLFMSRWKKRGQAKRESLLRAVAPHTAPNPWHCFDYFDPCRYPGFVSPYTARNPETRHRLLLPWLDIETLKTHPHVLFALLHYRLRHPPQAWAAFDIKQLNLGWSLGLFETRFAHRSVVVHGPRYGELIEWDFRAARRADILGFPKAELLFEAQAYLMTTLRDVVLEVLSGVDEGTSVQTSKWRELTSTSNFRLVNEIELWSPYIFPAFSSPPTLDLCRISSLANVRLGAIADHIWHLQCNPAYMRRQIKLCLGTKSSSEAMQTYYRWAFITNLCNEIHRFLMWRLVKVETKMAGDLQQRFRESIHQGEPLPREYEKLIGVLELLLKTLVNNTGCHLTRCTFNTRAFPNCFEIRPIPGRPTMREFQVRPSNTWKLDDRLAWCILNLCKKPNTAPYVFNNALLFRYFQHHLSVSSFQEKTRVSEFMYRWMDDMVAFSDILSLIRLERPRAECANVKAIVKLAYREEWQFQEEYHGNLNSMDTLLRDFFEAEPPSGNKDLRWLQRSRATRKILESFWEATYEFLSKAYEKEYNLSKDLVQQMLQVIKPTQSDEHQQAVSAEEAKILAEIERQKITQETPSHFTRSHDETLKAIATEEPRKEKIKTRPQERNQTDGIIPQELTDNQTKTPQPGEPPILVRTSKRALNTIRLMFPSTPEEASRSLQWTDFVYAMSDMGFIARYNGGSAVSFEADGQRRIVFHKPHPEPKIAPVMLQVMGARMNKWFGWERENFVLDEA
ncbi:hypothetical protein F5Y09DRAFT_352109 [Xylaria sp. FL1042]|nr:hypothetical protein F5Y09DRAFT_352109 [Xylaria sp. FL1042]